MWTAKENVVWRHLAVYLQTAIRKKNCLPKEKSWQLQNPELSVTADRDLRCSTDLLLAPATLFPLYLHLVFSLLAPHCATLSRIMPKTAHRSHRSSRDNSFYRTPADTKTVLPCLWIIRNGLIWSERCFSKPRVGWRGRTQRRINNGSIVGTGLHFSAFHFAFFPPHTSSSSSSLLHTKQTNKQSKPDCLLKLNPLKCTVCWTRICGPHWKFHLVLVCLCKH